MKIDSIYRFFENPTPIYLCQELAVCYILYVSLQEDSCSSELIQRLEDEYPSYRLSDTILYSALKFLEDERAITGYWKRIEKRGRPRRMYQVSPLWQVKAKHLAWLWQDYINRQTK
jgi:DNA-binding PadR family transcriptional regulator